MTGIFQQRKMNPTNLTKTASFSYNQHVRTNKSNQKAGKILYVGISKLRKPNPETNCMNTSCY